MEKRDVPNTNCIGLYLHCGKCLAEKPDGISPQAYGALEIGLTKLGLQVWCKRHDCNVAHIDFQGIKHPANMTAPEDAPTPEKDNVVHVDFRKKNNDDAG